MRTFHLFKKNICDEQITKSRGGSQSGSASTCTTLRIQTRCSPDGLLSASIPPPVHTDSRIFSLQHLVAAATGSRLTPSDAGGSPPWRPCLRRLGGLQWGVELVLGRPEPADCGVLHTYVTEVCTSDCTTRAGLQALRVLSLCARVRNPPSGMFELRSVS